MIPEAYRTLSGVYGQLRGYDRLRIQSEVCLNAAKQAEDIRALAERLFQRRVAASICRFPAYAEKVREYAGKLPEASREIELEQLPISKNRVNAI